MSNEKTETVVEGSSRLDLAALAETMAKLKAVIRADDCAALLIIAKPGGAEVLVSLDATWSCAKISEDGTFTMTTSALPREVANKAVYESANAISALADLAAKAGCELITASDFVNDKYGLTHKQMYHIPRTKPH